MNDNCGNCGMSEIAMKTAQMLDILPENERAFACEVVRKLVLSWDPDYTKLTPAEAMQLDIAMADTQTYSHDEVLTMLGIDEL